MNSRGPIRVGVACALGFVVLFGWRERALSQYVTSTSPGGGAAGALSPPWDQDWAWEDAPDCSDHKAEYDDDCWACEGSPPEAVPKFSWEKSIIQCPALQVLEPTNRPAVIFCLEPFGTNEAAATAPGYTNVQAGIRRWKANPEKCGDPHDEHFDFSEVEWRWTASGVEALPSAGEGEEAEFEYEVPDNAFTIEVEFTATGKPDEDECDDSVDSGIVKLYGNIGKLRGAKKYLGIIQPEPDEPPPPPDQFRATLTVTALGLSVVDSEYLWQLTGVCGFDPTPGRADASVTVKENGVPSTLYNAERVAGTRTLADDEGGLWTCTRQTNFTVVATKIRMPSTLCAATNDKASFPVVFTLEPLPLPNENEVTIIRSSSPVELLFEDSDLTVPAQSAYPASRFPLTLYHRLNHPGSYKLTAKHNLSRAQDRADYKIVRVEIDGPSNACVQCAIQLTVKGGDAPYQWESSDPSVASVDANGLVTGLTPGQTTITATDMNGCKGEKVVYVPKFELHMPQSACDGLVVPITLLLDPTHVKQHIVAVTFSATKPDGSTSFDNPDGQGITISQVGQDWTTWQIDNVRWYSTQPDHCNDTSEYKIQAFITLDTCADCKTTNYTFTADFTVPSKCGDGEAQTYQLFSGDIQITATQIATNQWEAVVTQGTFQRDVQARSWWTVHANSQYHDMIMNEELYHEISQFENPSHPLLKNLWSDGRVMTDVWAQQPFTGISEAAARQKARNAFDDAVVSELKRSASIFQNLCCAIEKEAKTAAGASHRAAMPCTYWWCP